MLLVRPRAGAQIFFTGLLLCLLMLLWMRAAVLIYALFFGVRPFPGLDHVVSILLTTPSGLVNAGRRIPGRRVVRGLRVRDQRILDPHAARPAHRRPDGDGHEHGHGVEQPDPDDRLGRASCSPSSSVSVVTGFLGFIVIFPLLGHATWHAYRAMR